jgi:hypothetical protein
MNEDENNQEPKFKSVKTGQHCGKPLLSTYTKEEALAQVEIANKRFNMGKYANGKTRQRAVDNGSLLDARPMSLRSIPETGRNEHYVWVMPDGFEGKLVKIPKNKNTTPLNSTPQGYLQRWAWMEQDFGLKSHLHDTTKEGELILVQDFIVGEHPTEKQLDEELKLLGWQKIGATKWLTPDSLWIIEDVDETNLLIQKDGSIMPIDVDITPSTKQMEKTDDNQGDLFT